MKKLISLVLALVTVICLSIPVLAKTNDVPEQTANHQCLEEHNHAHEGINAFASCSHSYRVTNRYPSTESCPAGGTHKVTEIISECTKCYTQRVQFQVSCSKC